MSPDTPDVTPPNAPSDAAEAAAPAPKRARAPRKTATKADVADAAGPADVSAQGEAPADAGAEAAPAPAPRKRARKAADAVVDAAQAPAAVPADTMAGSVDAAPVAADETPAPRAPRARARRVVAVDEAGDQAVDQAVAAAVAPAPAGAVAAEPVARAPGDEAAVSADRVDGGGDAGEGGDDRETSEAEAEGEGGAEGRRSRSRRRRRGRRGGSGAGEGASDALQADGGDAEGDDGEDADGGVPEGEGGEPRAARERPPRGDRPQRAIGPPVEFATADVSDTFADVLSGDFDTEPELVDGLPVIPAKRVLAAEPDAPKLHKVLAQSGIGSRRDMEQLITDGKVTVNGEVAHTGQRISFGDEVRVQGRVVKLRIAPPPARVIAYHKPAGEVVTMDDPEKRPTVFRRLPRLPHGKWQSVGRLDINTEGLLLFTNSGDLANKLMHPRFGVEREYAVRVLGTLDEESREKLLTGVVIDGQAAQFKTIEDGGGEGANRWYRVVITEGRNREVRKLFDAVGMAVSRLIRIRYGSVVLPKGLKRGVWVDLDDSDVRRLRQLAGAEQGQRDGGQQGQRDGGQQGQRDGGQPAQRDGQQVRGKGGNGGPGRNDRGPRGDKGPGQNAGGPQQGKNRNGRDRDRGRNRQEQGSPAPFREPGDPSFIPNPLQQTFDRRAIQQRERPVVATHYDDDEDGPIGPIPNPLQQTYDKRFVQGNRDAFGGKRKGGGGGGGGAQKQPDPLKTAVGYIGADAFVKKLNSRGGRGRR